MTAQTLSYNGGSYSFTKAIWNKRNPQKSFEELYRKYYPMVFSLCMRMMGNTWDAEDLTQDTFLQIQKKISKYHGKSAFTTWLYRVTVNQVLMHYRKGWTRSERVTDTGVMPEQSSSPSSIAGIELSSAIEELPSGYRKVFLLHDVEGYEHHEIAEKLCISSGTSKSQLHKARMKLRSLLGKKERPVWKEREENHKDTKSTKNR
jgi:RNA polymerase sigma-70 factor, ECF subfamily